MKMLKLKKKVNDEVGTSNTKERPINIVEDRMEELVFQKEELFFLKIVKPITEKLK